MRDLRSTTSMWVKAVLLVLIGLMASALIFIEVPEARTAVLLALVVWSFCRAYYFAFYVLERYVDPEYRFSGLVSLAWYVWKKRAGRR